MRDVMIDVAEGALADDMRTKLLEPRFSVHFEGELLERVEDLLRHEPQSEERETVPSEAPAKG